MQKKNVADYAKEYRSEIDDQMVEVSHLQKCGVTDLSLSAEIYLRDIYGDEIVNTSNIIEENVDEKTKQVQKIGETEKNSNDEFRSVLNDIEESEFDKNLEILLKR
jgi:hypothetical protein